MLKYRLNLFPTSFMIFNVFYLTGITNYNLHKSVTTI